MDVCLKDTLTASQVSNSWDLKEFVQPLDTTFAPRSGYTGEMVAEIKWFRGSGLRSRGCLRDVFEVCHINLEKMKLGCLWYKEMLDRRDIQNVSEIEKKER